MRLTAKSRADAMQIKKGRKPLLLFYRDISCARPNTIFLFHVNDTRAARRPGVFIVALQQGIAPENEVVNIIRFFTRFHDRCMYVRGSAAARIGSRPDRLYLIVSLSIGLAPAVKMTVIFLRASFVSFL